MGIVQWKAAGISSGFSVVSVSKETKHVNSSKTSGRIHSIFRNKIRNVTKHSGTFPSTHFLTLQSTIRHSRVRRRVKTLEVVGHCHV